MHVAVVGDNVVDIEGATAGQVLTVQPDGTIAAEDPFDLDAMRFKGTINASTNPNYPAASAGDLYRVSVAGKIGGASGTTVEVGDLFFAIADNAGGTQAAVGASWSVEQGNIDGAVIGPASVTDDLPAVFDGTTGKLIKSKTYAAFKVLLSLVKGDVGLGNVDNTSDANKPVSTAQQTALDAKVSKTLYDAHSVLAAQADDTPVVVPVGEATLLGRIVGGDVGALSLSQIRTLLGLNAVVINATNANAFTVPAGVTLLEVIAVGGGGQGGGGSTSSTGSVQAGSSGGGAGGYTRSIKTVAPGDVIAVTIGAGGSAAGGGAAAGGNAGTQGSNGGTTSVTNGSWTASAAGGQGGFGATANANTAPGGGVYGGAAWAAGVGGLTNGTPGCGAQGGTSSAQRPAGAPIGASGGGGGGGGCSSTTNGGLGGGAGTASAAGAGAGQGGSGTTAGTGGAAAAANTGAGGGGGGAGTNNTGAGGAGGAGGSGYVVLRCIG